MRSLPTVYTKFTPFKLDETRKARKTRHKGRNSAAQAVEPNWTRQHKKCVQYNFKFIPVYSESG